MISVMHISTRLNGKRIVIFLVCALYGLNSDGYGWCYHLANRIKEELGYAPCQADQDIYMKPKTKKDGSTYYSYIFVYVVDIICIDENPREIMNKIASIYRMKENNIGPPKIHIGANVKKC